jgi:hypothetical protein
MCEGAAHHNSPHRQHDQQDQPDVLPPHSDEARAKAGDEILLFRPHVS